MIEILFGISAILGLICFLLYKNEHKKNDMIQKKYKEQDVVLTQYIAKNLDMEKELSQMQRECEKQKVLAEEVQRMHGQIRALKHDMKNHTLVILSYLEEEKNEEAKHYAGELLDKLNKMYTYVHVGNALLNYILNHKLSMAKEQGCEIKAEIENLAFSYMDSVDFSALVNNLLDNAMEGALHSREKKVEVSILRKKGFDVISIKNSIDASILESNPKLLSTKKESGHGLGMKQIQSIVEKYHGSMDIYEKENMFNVNIILGEYSLSQ